MRWMFHQKKCMDNFIFPSSFLITTKSYKSNSAFTLSTFSPFKPFPAQKITGMGAKKKKEHRNKLRGKVTKPVITKGNVFSYDLRLIDYFS